MSASRTARSRIWGTVGISRLVPPADGSFATEMSVSSSGRVGRLGECGKSPACCSGWRLGRSCLSFLDYYQSTAIVCSQWSTTHSLRGDVGVGEGDFAHF